VERDRVTTYADLNITAPPSVVLSPRQFEAAAALCVAGRGLPAAALNGSLDALVRLGIIEARAVGALEPLYHLTQFGRSVVCDQSSDDDPVVGPYEKEVPLMSTITPDPKPSAKKRAPRKPKAETPAVETPEVPAVEDVTDAIPAAAPKADLTPVFDALLARVLELVGDGSVVEKKAAYTRVSLGKAVVYINNPTTKSVRVEVPEVDGPGYDVVKLTSTDEFGSVIPLIEKRIEILAAKAAAKEAAAA
jgi:hypothetical protein